MPKYTVKSSDQNDGPVTLVMDTDAGTFTLTGTLLRKPRASSTGATALAASVTTRYFTDDDGEPQMFDFGGEQYRLRIGANIIADGENKSDAQLAAKAKRKAEQAEARAAAARAELQRLTSKAR